MLNVYRIKAKVWLYPGMAAWHFVTIPKFESKKIKLTFGDMHAGFGSLPVNVVIGKTNWKTSIFPDSKVGSYILPLKAEVRKKEAIKIGDTIKVTLEIRV